jgi:DNA-binding winged helix-turn-helix (wHTH) protein
MGRRVTVPDADLTAKEQLLLDYFRGHPNEVCEKDELITAVWPEDEIFEQGVRDSSLAQLIRRLRVKIEVNAADPQFIQTVAGRGYIYKSGG